MKKEDITKRDLIDAGIVIDGIDVQGTGVCPQSEHYRLADKSLKLLRHLAMHESYNKRWVKEVIGQWESWGDCELSDGNRLAQILVIIACDRIIKRQKWDVNNMCEYISYTPIIK